MQQRAFLHSDRLPSVPSQIPDRDLQLFLAELTRWLSRFQDTFNRLISSNLSETDPLALRQKQSNLLPDAHYFFFNARQDRGGTFRKVDYGASSWAMRFDRSADKYEILYSAPNQDPISWTTYLSFPGSGVPSGSTDVLTVGTSGGSDPTFNSLTLNSATPLRLLQTDAAKKLVSVLNLTAWIAGTVNRVTVADDGDGTVTLSAPQDLHAGASPTFAGLTITSILQIASALLTLSEGVNMVFGTTTGTKLGTSPLQKLSFWNAPPVVQPADLGALTDNTGQVPDRTLEDVPALTVAPGALAGAADRVEVNDRLTRIEKNLSDLADFCNDLRDVLRSVGLMA